MNFLRYLHQKVTETNNENVSVFASQEMLNFLDKFNVQYKKKISSELYLVNSKELKALFCN